MSPRRTRPARRSGAADGDDSVPLLGGAQGVETDPDGTEWVVRRITGSASSKVYRCPGCDQEITPATPHVVAWPSLDVDNRRHWHTPCWNARGRRGARSIRPPRF